MNLSTPRAPACPDARSNFGIQPTTFGCGLIPALSAYTVELTGLHRREGFEDRRHERLEMRHAIGWRPDEQYAERKSGEILLELDAPVHRDQYVVLVLHAPEKLAVRDP